MSTYCRHYNVSNKDWWPFFSTINQLKKKNFEFIKIDYLFSWLLCWLFKDDLIIKLINYLFRVSVWSEHIHSISVWESRGQSSYSPLTAVHRLNICTTHHLTHSPVCCPRGNPQHQLQSAGFVAVWSRGKSCEAMTASFQEMMGLSSIWSHCAYCMLP